MIGKRTKSQIDEELPQTNKVNNLIQNIQRS